MSTGSSARRAAAARQQAAQHEAQARTRDALILAQAVAESAGKMPAVQETPATEPPPALSDVQQKEI